jgi:hypothetical protein
MMIDNSFFDAVVRIVSETTVLTPALSSRRGGTFAAPLQI